MPTRFNSFLVVCFFNCLVVNQSVAQTDGKPMMYGRQFTMHSKLLGEDRTYWVSLPVSYDDPRFAPQHYPVLYLPDGKSNFFPVSGLVNFMSGKESVNYQIPELIIVGIDNADRVKDLTPVASNRLPDGSLQSGKNGLIGEGSGGGEPFFQFLTTELIPKIEATYRTAPYRVYVGHSLGGLTTTHTLLHHPGVFDGYMAIDPSLWWDGASLLNTAAQPLKQYGTAKKQRYFLSVVDSISGDAQSRFHLQSIHRFADTLAQYAPTTVGWQKQIFPHTDHSSIPLLSWYYGLLFIFDGYELNLPAMMQNPDLIDRHFKDMANRTGLNIPPPEPLFEILTHYLTAPNRYPDAKKAIQVIEIGLKAHPDSPFLNEKLGLAYGINHEPQKALAAYRKALTLNPASKSIQQAIADLNH